VGHIKVANLMRIRQYVPAKTVWGAIVHALVQHGLSKDFEEAQNQVSEHLAFSYFFPALAENEPLYPRYTEKGLRYGVKGMTADEFERRLLSSYGSTALDYFSNTALQGSLHETEFISPFDQIDGKPVYLIGYIFERESSDLGWKKVLSEVRLGGERKLGWGKVRLERIDVSPADFFGLDVRLNTDRPWVKMKANNHLMAHCEVGTLQARGQIEPFLGRETREAVRFGGALVDHVPVCWVPGSLVLEDVVLQIDKSGVHNKVG